MTLSYLDKLQRQNAEDLAFYPKEALQKALDAGHVLWATENDEPAGYLWFGALRPHEDVIIYQACIDYEARRRHLGFSIVAKLSALARAAHSTGIRLKCASSSQSNEFWIAAGFYCTKVQPGGIKRGRDLNCYRTDIANTLITVPSVVPSDKPTDLRPYQKMKRDGIPMPSRFSRSHY